MVLPHDENSGNGIDLLDGKDDSLAPLASFDGEDVGAGYIPHQFLLRRPQHGQPQPQHHHQHHSHPHRHRRHHLQLHTEVRNGGFFTIFRKLTR